MFKYVVAVSLLLTTVAAYSKGAPDAVCQDLKPQHGKDPQTSSAPYSVVHNSGDIKAGNKIKLTLKGANSDAVIKGFVVQARVNGKPVGKMIPGPNSQLLKCSSDGDSLTHTKIEKKINEINFEWIPPNDIAGKKVDFTATVVQRGDLFWVAKPLLSKTAA